MHAYAAYRSDLQQCGIVGLPKGVRELHHPLQRIARSWIRHACAKMPPGKPPVFATPQWLCDGVVGVVHTAS
jgi:hypothetical protein